MPGKKILNSDLDLQGKLTISTVPNSTGTVVTYNSTGKEISTRTNTEIISDMSLMTTDTNQTVTGQKTFWTIGGNGFNNHALRVQSQDGSNPGMTFYKGAVDIATIQFDGTNFKFRNSTDTLSKYVSALGYKKDGSDNSFFLLGGGDHISASNYPTVVQADAKYVPYTGASSDVNLNGRQLNNASTVGVIQGNTAVFGSFVGMYSKSPDGNAIYLGGVASTVGSYIGQARYVTSNQCQSDKSYASLIKFGNDGTTTIYGNTGLTANTTYSPTELAKIDSIGVYSRSMRTSRLGTFGTYNVSETQGIWSISSGYNVDSSTTGLGTQYGLAYSYIGVGGSSVNNTHQIHFTNNGVATVSVITSSGIIRANQFQKVGGLATQFLKADGSVDSNSYSLTTHVHNFSDITNKPTTLLGYGITDAFQKQNVIGTTIDLNTLTLEGVYYGYQWVNSPSTSAIASVTVKRYSNDWIRQEFNLINGSSVTYVRDRSSGTTWSDWKVLADRDWVANNYSPTTHTHTFASLTAKPTTIAGYGITDALTQAQFNVNNPDLTAIEALAGVDGYLRKDGNGQWSLTASPVVDATATIAGKLKLFSDTVQTVASNAVTAIASRTYGIQLNSVGQAVVNVPWVDTNTSYTAGNGLTLTGTVFSLPITVSGSGNYITDVVQNANGITVTKGTLPTYVTQASLTTQLATKINALDSATGLGFVGGTPDTPYVKHSNGTEVTVATETWCSNNFLTIHSNQNVTGVKTFTVSPKVPSANNPDEVIPFGQATEVAISTVRDNFLTRTTNLPSNVTFDLSNYSSPMMTNIIVKGNPIGELYIDGLDQGMTIKIMNTTALNLIVRFDGGSLATGIGPKTWIEVHRDSEGDLIKNDTQNTIIIT